MKKRDCELIENLMEEMERCADKKEKSNIRNRIFAALQSNINCWVKSFLNKKGEFMEESEILSLSWDCFEFSLNSYRPEKKIPLINHFFAYTKFYLMSANSKKNAENSRLSLKSEDFSDFEIENDEKVLNSLEELKKFRELLGEDLSPIFDDALMSMRASTKDRQRRLDKTPLNYSRYHNSKKIFKIVIDFLLRR